MIGHTDSLQAHDLVFHRLFNEPFTISIAGFQVQLEEQNGQPVLILNPQATSEESPSSEGDCNQPACPEVSLLNEIHTLTQSNGISNLQMTLSSPSQQSSNVGYYDRYDTGKARRQDERYNRYTNSLHLKLSFSLNGNPVNIPLHFQHRHTKGLVTWLWGIIFFNTLYGHTEQSQRFFNPLGTQVLQVVIEVLRTTSHNNILINGLPHGQGASVARNPETITPQFLGLQQPTEITQHTLVEVLHSSPHISTFTAGSITYNVSLQKELSFPLSIVGTVPPVVTINHERLGQHLVMFTVLVLILGSFFQFLSWM